MKKILTILLATAIILAMSVSVFAAENTTLTIENSDGRTYYGYKLLNLTTSLKDGEHPAPCDGTKHVVACYNYAYTVNEKYRSILQNEVFAKIATKPEAATDITDAQILEYLAAQESDGENNDYKSMRDVADRLYRAIKESTLSEDATLTGENKTIAQGYWMFADVSALDGNEANSLVMVDTKGQDELTITPKTDLPTIEKKVKDINNSNDDSIDDNAWQDSADHDINDVVPFKLTATLPDNVTYFEEYKIVFHDKLSDGFTFDKTSVKVYMYATKDDADNNNNGVDVTDNFVTKTDDLNDNDCTFEVTCEDVLSIDDVTKDTAFVVYYEATLDTDAVIGAAGNPNEVYLEFSNDPYSDGTGKTEKDRVIVFTYKLVINKVDSDNNPLKGAGFTLYKKGSDGKYAEVGDEISGTDMTQFVWTGLDDGDYKLEESTVPAGYNKMADKEFTISAEHDEISDTPSLISLSGGNLATGVVDTGIIEQAIVNNAGTVLPETGAAGTMWLIFGGAVIAILAAVFMVTRKKMSVYED